MPYGSYREQCSMLEAFDSVDPAEAELNKKIEGALGCDYLGRKTVHNKHGKTVEDPEVPSYKVTSQIYRPRSSS